MPKIISHPRFSSEFNNIFPMPSLQVLQFPMPSLQFLQQFFGIQGTVQCSQCSSNISFHILPWIDGVWEEGISPCAALALVTSSSALTLHPLGCGAVCIPLILLLPRQGFSMARSNHCGGSLHRIFDTECTWLFTASDTLFWGVGLQLVQKVQVGFGF